MRRLLPLALVATMLTTGGAVAIADHDHRAEHARPLIIGHRGASGYRPEHTLASYELAARMGADYIEPDLVPTKDGVLVARHEPEISGTTDVARHPEFASRKTTKTIDGQQVTGWFTEDFTLEELKTLRAVERLPGVRQHNTIFDGRFQVPTFQEILDLRARLEKELHRRIGVYPETKHPTYFKSIGLDTTPKLVAALKGQKDVFIQSFEDGNLRDLHRQGVTWPLIRLLSAGDKVDFGDIASYADGVGPDKAIVTKPFVDAAHAHGLLVHPYTFRPENQFLPADLRSSSDPSAYGNLIAEMRRYFAMGVDGIFTDTPDIGVEARRG